jgi:hypothetical protein
MKQKNSFQMLCLTVSMLLALGSQHAFAQNRFVAGKKPDLVLQSVAAKKEGSDKLNVTWTVKNVGDAPVKEFDNLVTLNVESSDKAIKAGVTQNWAPRGNRISLGSSKKEILPGETVSGNCWVSCATQDVACLKVSLDTGDIEQETQKGNNIQVTQLVGK